MRGYFFFVCVCGFYVAYRPRRRDDLLGTGNAGIKREGLLYFEKYGTGGPKFGIKEEFVTERGRQLFHARA